MTDTIESFVAKLKTEGVQQGQRQADELRQQAKQEMDQEIEQARQQAEKIVADAQAQAKSIMERSGTELELAARDAAGKLRESLTSALQAVLTKPVGEQLNDAEFLESIIQDMATNYAQADAKGETAIKINITDEMKKQLADWAVKKLQIASGQTPTVTNNLKQAGFEINASGATIEITQESVISTLMELVGPSLRDIFDKAMAGGKV